MLVIVDLFHVKVLSRLKVHHMDVEVVFVACRKQLPQYKYFRCDWQYWAVFCGAVLEGWLALSGSKMRRMTQG
jgi:hypothetical protein